MHRVSHTRRPQRGTRPNTPVQWARYRPRGRHREIPPMTPEKALVAPVMGARTGLHGNECRRL